MSPTRSEARSADTRWNAEGEAPSCLRHAVAGRTTIQIPCELTEEKAFGYRYPNGTIHPTLVWPYLLGLQVAGLNEESDRILTAMIGSARKGRVFQNGIVNKGGAGVEHFFIDGKPCGYEGFLPESFNFLMGVFTRDPAMRAKLLSPMAGQKKQE